MIDRRLFILLFLLVAGTIALFWLTEVPLGVAGEWTWERIRIEPDGIDESLFGLLMAAVVAAAYLAFVWLGAKRLANASRMETSGWLIGLVTVGFFWLFFLQESPGSDHRLQKAAYVLYYPQMSGYFYEARYEFESSADFLANYEDLMREGDYLHVGTHPPGLFLLHRGLIRLCERSDALTSFLLQTQPESVREFFLLIETNNLRSGRSFGGSDRAAIWLAALLTQLLAMATVIPLYWLLRRDCSRVASWLAISLWPLLPAVAIFLPKSDALYPFIGTLFLATWIYGWRRRSILLCSSAGLLLWVGMFLSLAVLPVVVLAAVFTAWEAWKVPIEERPVGATRSIFVSKAWAAIGLVLPILILWYRWDINLLNVWRSNYLNHAAFYDHFTRTWWKWLLVNPVELALGIGLPVAVLVVTGWKKTLRLTSSWTSPRLTPYWSCAIVGGLLWVSGKNMGEAARLWLFLMPWCLWLSGTLFEESPPDEENSDGTNPLRFWIVIAVLQAIVCVATVTRVTGFHSL